MLSLFIRASQEPCCTCSARPGTKLLSCTTEQLRTRKQLSLFIYASVMHSCTPWRPSTIVMTRRVNNQGRRGGRCCTLQWVNPDDTFNINETTIWRFKDV